MLHKCNPTMKIHFGNLTPPRGFHEPSMLLLQIPAHEQHLVLTKKKKAEKSISDRGASLRPTHKTQTRIKKVTLEIHTGKLDLNTYSGLLQCGA